MQNSLIIKYIPVAEAVLFELNPKKHDLGAIAESIQRYGFRNPPIFDATLNGGAGGIVAGNGRIETLQSMESQGQSVPRGIALDDQGRWLVPIIFGCDASSEIEAQAYAIDDNNLTMSGGDFDHFDMANLWDREGYLQLLSCLAEAQITPITVDEDAIASLLFAGDEGQGETGGGEDEDDKPVQRCPNCGHEFSN